LQLINIIIIIIIIVMSCAVWSTLS